MEFLLLGYQQAVDEFGRQGFRLVYVNGFTSFGQDRYSAIWVKSPGPRLLARHGMSPPEYQQAVNDMSAQGLRLTCVSGYGDRGQDRYAAIWEERGGPPLEARHGLSSRAYEETFETLVARGFRLVFVNAHTNNGEDRFAAIWEQSEGPAWRAAHDLTAEAYQLIFEELTSQGFQPLQVCGYGDAVQARFIALWELRPGAMFEARHGLKDAQYQLAFEEFRAKGLRPTCVSGY